MTNTTTTTQPLSAAGVSKMLETLTGLTGDTTMPIQQITLLLALYTYGQITQQELGKHTGVNRSSNSRNIAKLGIGEDPVKRPGPGLVESYEDPQDRRTKMVRLTPKGHAIVRSALAGHTSTS